MNLKSLVDQIVAEPPAPLNFYRRCSVCKLEKHYLDFKYVSLKRKPGQCTECANYLKNEGYRRKHASRHSETNSRVTREVQEN